MRILAISGSLRRDSYNTALLRAARDIAPAGVAVELYEGLAAIPAFNEDLESDPPAPVVDLRERIGEADALLIATPEYNGSAPGALKNALDWASRPRGGAALIAKPAAVVGASPSSFGAQWAQEQIRRALMLSGAMVVDPELAVPKVEEKVVDGELVDGGVRTKLGEVLAALAETADAEQALAA
jgi:chromate reductase, NAD(P)H dehydrogenase (quinone)